MPLGEFIQMLAIVIIAIGLALGVNTILLRTRQKQISQPKKVRPENLPVFLFDGPYLADATHSAHEIIRRRSNELSEREALVQLLRPVFPTLEDDISKLPDQKESTLISPEDQSLSIDVWRDGEVVKLTLRNAGHLDTSLRYKALEEEAFEEEARNLHLISENAPQLIWQEDEDGQVIWANKAYLRYADLHAPPTEFTGKVWPSKRLFSGIPTLIEKDALPLTTRRSLQLHNQNAEHWFDVTTMPAPKGSMHYAVDANEVMRAEESQKAFIATIANTFAQLSIGLAIFDRKRRLSSYNPAFGDLTGLPAQFLISRPTIEIVLDRLRDLGKLPEPKDYSSFREQFTALESAAKEGTYIENWELPDGQTYQVTGKPHPNGALALLFEDVTAEISLTRRFRTEIETSQAVLDNIPDAIAVFSQSNALVISNIAYENLWGEQSISGAITYDLRKALKTWKSGCASNMIWRGIETFANTTSDREPWSDKVLLKDGRQATCHVLPLSGGMTMIKFTMAGRHAPVLQKLTAVDPALRAQKL